MAKYTAKWRKLILNMHLDKNSIMENVTLPPVLKLKDEKCKKRRTLTSV